MALNSGLALYAVFPDLGTYDPENPNYYPIEEGSVFTDDYNETLDTGTIIISNVPETDSGRLIDISVYDTVLVYSSLNGSSYTLIKRMLVDRFEDTRTRTTTPFYHSFTIYLFSETKALEGICLPNMSFTKRPSSSGDYVYQVFDHISELLNQYSPRKRVGTSSIWNWVQVFSISTTQDLVTKFSNECPDMQWNKPTLREVLNDLMLTQYCIPKLENGKLGYLDLEQRNGELTSSQLACIDTYKKSQDSSDWASDLSVTADNVTNNEQENVDNTINVCEMVSFRNEDDYVLKNPSNMRITTSYPIYSDPKVIMCFVGYKAANSKHYYFEFDISKAISEYQKHITKPVIYGKNPYYFPWNTPNSSGDYFTKYQNFCLYYHRGSNYIDGFSQYNSWITLTSVYHAYEIESLFESASKEMLLSGLPNWGTDSFSYPDCVFFKVEYQTLASDKALIGRRLPPKHHFEVFDKQSSSYSDSQKLGLFEYSKVNRIGNKIRLLSGRFTDYSLIPTLSQTYDGATCYERTIVYDKNCFIADLKFTDDYVLQDYFNSVRAKIRSWKIATDSEALERHDVFKVFCELSKNRKTDNLVCYPYSIGVPASYFSTSLTPMPHPNTINESFVRTEFGSNYYPSFDGGYCLDTQVEVFGDSLKFTFGFSDNYKVSNHITQENDSNIGGWGQSPYPYVDSDTGETTYGEAHFMPKTDPGDGILTWPKPADEITSESEFKSMRSLAWGKPVFPSLPSESVMGMTWNLHKDNRDITKITTQFEFCVDTKDIVFGRKFLERQKAVSTLLEASTAPSSYSGTLLTISIVNSIPNIIDDSGNEILPSASNQGISVLSYGNILSTCVYDSERSRYVWEQQGSPSLNSYYSYNGDSYLDYNGQWKKVNVNSDLHIYGFFSANFDGTKANPTLPSGGVAINSSALVMEQSSDYHSEHIYIPSEGYLSIAICDSSDNIILAWNGTGSAGVWLNLILSRDCNVYSGDEKVGTIVV